MVPRFSVMRSRAGRGSEGIGQGSGAVPRRPPAHGMRPRGIRQQFLWSSARQAAGGCPGNIPHRDPITGRNCFVKYQTLMARPEIGNRFICVAGCSSPLSPSLPPHRAASENPSMGLEQMGCGSSWLRGAPHIPRPWCGCIASRRKTFPPTPEPAQQNWTCTVVYSGF